MRWPRNAALDRNDAGQTWQSGADRITADHRCKGAVGVVQLAGPEDSLRGGTHGGVQHGRRAQFTSVAFAGIDNRTEYALSRASKLASRSKDRGGVKWLISLYFSVD